MYCHIKATTNFTLFSSIFGWHRVFYPLGLRGGISQCQWNSMANHKMFVINSVLNPIFCMDKTRVISVTIKISYVQGFSSVSLNCKPLSPENSFLLSCELNGGKVIRMRSYEHLRRKKGKIPTIRLWWSWNVKVNDKSTSFGGIVLFGINVLINSVG